MNADSANLRDQNRRRLYPAIEPFRTDRLQVSSLHDLYFEQCGRPDGLPVVALHGGPGGGASPEMRRFFDPQRFCVTLFDQRGCGRSRPHACLDENTTWDLVADIEKLREHIGCEKWIVFGGSWGTTLALSYAAKHPERVAGLILRGIFLLTKAELRWFYQEGASHIFPDAFERYVAPIPVEERADLISAFRKRLTADNPQIRIEAARAWSRWEGETISIEGPQALPPRFNEDPFVEAFARIENHYFVHDGFFPEDGWLLRQVDHFRHIDAFIVHGRYDMCTPMSSAWALKSVWPQARLEIVPDAGHSSLEPGIVDALVRACDWFAGQSAG